MAASYARRGPVMEAYDYVLIICEGAKTEPNYFQGLRTAYGLSSANIVVMSPDGTDPITIVKAAEENLRAEYDRIFCVFDRDGHANYHEAIKRVADSGHGKSGKITAVPSWPCFEFWLLLHFKYTSAAFEAGGGRSSCDQVLRELRDHLPDYVKGHETVFADLRDKLEIAMKHAKRLAADNKRTRSVNPATMVHELVAYLIGLKK